MLAPSEVILSSASYEPLCAHKIWSLATRTIAATGQMLTVGLACLLLIAEPVSAKTQERWVSAWTFPPVSTAGPVVPSGPPNPNDIRGPAGSAMALDQTLTQTSVLSVSGRAVRLRLSNLYGYSPVMIGAVTIASEGQHPVAVHFDGQRHARIAVGTLRLSDPVPMTVQAGTALVVSVYLPGETRLPHHRVRMVVREGDQTSLHPDPGSRQERMGTFLSGIEVTTSTDVGVIVAFGDSITEGVSASPNGDGGWPERLALRLRSTGNETGVVNAGIGGNRLLHQGSGPSGLERLDADALVVSGAQCLILLEGINDIGRPARREYVHEAITAADLISGYRQVIARARAAGLRVVIATVPPFEGFNYFTETGETIRQSVNAWIRTSGEPDAFVDFDHAIRNPANHRTLQEVHDSGDGLHPSDAGYQAMADAVPLDICPPRV